MLKRILNIVWTIVRSLPGAAKGLLDALVIITKVLSGEWVESKLDTITLWFNEFREIQAVQALVWTYFAIFIILLILGWAG